MADNPNRADDVLLWVKNAEEDYDSAGKLLDAGGAPSVICFLCQQTAEKYLKALLIYQDIEVVYTHELDALVDLIPTELNLEAEIAGYEELTDYAVGVRYPGFGNEIDATEAGRVFDIASAVREAVRRKLTDILG